MRFGVNILNFGAGTDPSTLEGWARYAEERELAFAMISDHVAVTPDVAEQYPAPFYDPFATLAWLSGRTARIGLGTTVAILPYRHPLHTARLVANIDRFSGGRFIFGVGVSWPKQEYAALGIPFDRRGAIADEYLDVITRAWRQETLSYDGEFVSFDQVRTGPPPVRRPPVWVGGHSPAALRRTVRFADAWHPLNLTMDFIRDQGLPGLRRAAEAAQVPTPGFAPRLPLRVTESPLRQDGRLVGQGSLDQILADLEQLAELGATDVLFDTYPGSPAALRPIEADLAMLDPVLDALRSRFRR